MLSDILRCHLSYRQHTEFILLCPLLAPRPPPPHVRFSPFPWSPCPHAGSCPLCEPMHIYVSSIAAPPLSCTPLFPLLTPLSPLYRQLNHKVKIWPLSMRLCRFVRRPPQGQGLSIRPLQGRGPSIWHSFHCLIYYP
jgi:hypothetical protein